MKKLISAFLCTALLVTAAPVAFASAPENDNDTVTMIPTSKVTDLAINESYVLDDGAVLTRIPYDEYVRETATYNGVTENEVIDSEPARAQSNGGSYYYGFTKTQALDSNGLFNATLVATLRLYAYNGYGQIEGISDIKTRIASGLYLCKWEHDGASSTPAETSTSSFPCGRIDIAGNGHFYIDVALNYNQQQTVEGCGFTAGGAAGVYWTSREMFIFGGYQCY